MSLKPQPISPVPKETARVARAAFPKGSAFMRMRDELGVLWEDEDFSALFPRRGQPALAPWRLALVTVMQFAEDLPRIVTRVDTTPAHLSDVAQTQKVHGDLHRRNLLPKEHMADAGFVDADLLVKSALEHGIDLIGPVRHNVGWQARTEGAYDISRFTIDWEAKKAACPEGKESRTWNPITDPWGNADIIVKFARKDCRACKSRALCTRSKDEPRHLTLLPNKAEHEMIQAARVREKTPGWKSKYERRAGIEGTFSRTVILLGVRRARYRGQEKVGLEHVLTAVALSILRAMEWLGEITPQKSRVSAFAKLAA